MMCENMLSLAIRLWSTLRRNRQTDAEIWPAGRRLLALVAMSPDLPATMQPSKRTTDSKSWTARRIIDYPEGGHARRTLEPVGRQCWKNQGSRTNRRVRRTPTQRSRNQKGRRRISSPLCSKFQG
uniref:Uncharacterized protein n=1 Tax=Candidatus Kentrum sp. FM TaxID=2126340 RepID=A0A450T3Q7_9GAMM|nr:MAG: hypothetical protein BECKFM1743C_GA0114222_100172 [Candidatus Kentron sp. FM]VFJ61181.1 MAG: hypothetical protein BECKFM1743A_GA0114220_102802 [Candidatus Kentron sp. FM]VFK11435.1 MAG: hypothetical protein BECKFM1743B_GA0114221_101822 [Candidatus Kentron sp. FM]